MNMGEKLLVLGHEVREQRKKGLVLARPGLDGGDDAVHPWVAKNALREGVEGAHESLDAVMIDDSLPPVAGHDGSEGNQVECERERAPDHGECEHGDRRAVETLATLSRERVDARIGTRHVIIHLPPGTLGQRT